MTDKNELPGLPAVVHKTITVGDGGRYPDGSHWGHATAKRVVQIDETEWQAFAAVYSLIATRAPGAVAEGVKTLVDALNADPGFAWSWHCNVAMAAYDEGLDHAAANRAAYRFMYLLGCDTSKNEHYAATQATAAPAPAESKPAEPVVRYTREQIESALTQIYKDTTGDGRETPARLMAHETMLKIDRIVAALRGEG